MNSPAKIRVLECIRQGQIGGGESHLLSLVENLDRTRFEPVVLSFTDGPMIDRLQQMGVTTHVIYTTKPFNVLKWSTVKRFIEKENIQLIHAHGTRAFSNVVWAARTLKLPVVYTIHGWSFHDDQKWWIKQLRVAGESYLVNRSDINISVSKSNQLTGKKMIPSFDSIVINNGINLKKFNASGSYPDIREELNIPKDAIVLIFIARFTRQKQPLALIEAFKKALASNDKLHLLMVGDGEDKPEAIQLVKKLKLEDKTTMLAARSDVPALLAASDIFVLPSLWEGLPIGLLEAMSMGKAIIASNADGTIEIIEEGKNGLLVQINDLIATTAAAITSLSNDGLLRKKLGEEAKTTITQRFNAGVMTDRIEELYNQLIEAT
jgi:glycosyltransferase involved in cell wall biosynthesis